MFGFVCDCGSENVFVTGDLQHMVCDCEDCGHNWEGYDAREEEDPRTEEEKREDIEELERMIRELKPISKKKTPNS